MLFLVNITLPFLELKYLKQIIFELRIRIESEHDLRSWITTQAAEKEAEEIQAWPGIEAWSLRWPDVMLYPLS